MNSLSPLLGFNNNVRHRGRLFHIQTEDSGCKHPHVITHLFADGGRILKTVKTSYAEHLGSDQLPQIVRDLMKGQHKAMFIALRDGEFDHLFPEDVGPPVSLPPVSINAPPSSGAAASTSNAPRAPAPGVPVSMMALRSGARPSPAVSDLVSAPENHPAARAGVPAEPANAPAAQIQGTLGAPSTAAPKKTSPASPAATAHAPGAADPPDVWTVSPPPVGAAATGNQKPTETPQTHEPRTPAPKATIARDAGALTGAVPGPRTSPTAPSADKPAGALANRSPASNEQALASDANRTLAARRTASASLKAVPGDPASPPTLGKDLRPTATGTVPSAAGAVADPQVGPAAAPAEAEAPAARAASTRDHPSGKYVTSRPATVFATASPDAGGSIFGDELVSEKSLDEVILSYLSEDLDTPPKK